MRLVYVSVCVVAFLRPAPVPRTQVKASKYEAMTLDQLKNETQALTKQLFDMKMEKCVDKKIKFKSTEFRKIKKERARVQPFLDAKLAAATEATIEAPST